MPCLINEVIKINMVVTLLFLCSQAWGWPGGTTEEAEVNWGWVGQVLWSPEGCPGKTGTCWEEGHRCKFTEPLSSGNAPVGPTGDPRREKHEGLQAPNRLTPMIMMQWESLMSLWAAKVKIYTVKFSSCAVYGKTKAHWLSRAFHSHLDKCEGQCRVSGYKLWPALMSSASTSVQPRWNDNFIVSSSSAITANWVYDYWQLQTSVSCYNTLIQLLQGRTILRFRKNTQSTQTHKSMYLYTCKSHVKSHYVSSWQIKPKQTRKNT